MLLLLTSCGDSASNTQTSTTVQEFVLDRECSVGDLSFRMDRAELEGTEFRLYLSEVEDPYSLFMDYLILLEIEGDNRCGSNDPFRTNSEDTMSYGGTVNLIFDLTDKLPDGETTITPEQIISLRISDQEKPAVEAVYTQFMFELDNISND